MPLEIEDVLAPLAVDEFLEKYWGKRTYSHAVAEHVLEYLKVAFLNGDLEEVAEKCRRDDNSMYSPEDIREFQSDLDERRKTVPESSAP